MLQKFKTWYATNKTIVNLAGLGLAVWLGIKLFKKK